MGASESAEELPELPQQQIIRVVDGQVQLSADAPGHVGQRTQAVAVRAPLSLRRGGVHVDAAGVVTAEVAASADGVAELFAPVFEAQQDCDWPSALVPLRGGVDAAFGVAPDPASVRRRPVRAADAAGGVVVVRFDRPGEALPREVLDLDQQQEPEHTGEGRRWPLALVLRPGAAEPGQAAVDPPDGTLLVSCLVQRGPRGPRLVVKRQLIAWGGCGQAYAMQELYGLQEANAGAAGAPGGEAPAADDGGADDQRKCVVCLTQQKDTALMPCGHFCACYECAAFLRLAPARNRCPLCRREVQDIVHIDVAKGLPAEVEEAAGGAGGQAPDAACGADGEAAADAAAGPPARGPQVMSPEELRAARLRALSAAASPAAADAPAVAPATAAGTAAGGGAGRPGTRADQEAPAAAAAAGGSSSSSAAPPASEAGALPVRCLQRLTRELRKVEEQRQQMLDSQGVDIRLSDESGDDLRAWTLRVLASGVDAQSELGRQLKAAGAEAIEFEVWIPNAFPTEPPRVRVLAPEFLPGSFFVQQHGALCLEILTNQGWSPAMSFLQLGVQVKSMMSAGQGRIAGAGPMGEPGPSGRERAWATARRIESVHTDWQVFSTT